MAIRVCIAGVSGWVGSILAESVVSDPDLELSAVVSRSWAGQPLSDHLTGAPAIYVSPDVTTALKVPTDVMIDYTAPEIVKSNLLTAIHCGVHCVVGTSGLSDSDYDEISAASMTMGVGVLAAGNFSITASLLMKFSLMAAKLLPQREIIDYGTATKPDAPSGTARELAFRLGQVGRPQLARIIDQTVGLKEARGASVAGTQVHSVRSPGYISSCEIIFARNGERLRITQDTLNSAEPYVAGTLLAAKKAVKTKGLIRGMDRILEIE